MATHGEHARQIRSGHLSATLGFRRCSFRLTGGLSATMSQHGWGTHPTRRRLGGRGGAEVREARRDIVDRGAAGAAEVL